MLNSRRAALIAAGLTVVCVAFTASPAAAYTQQGRTRYIIDGDTTKVDIYGDNKADWISVRNAGIQAMEIGQCHAAPAKSAMSALVANRVVTMSSSTSTSSNSGRPLRFIGYKTSTGVAVDVQKRLLEQGHVLWYPLAPELGRSYTYHLAQSKAVVAGRNLWNKTYCGVGPQQDANLKVVINYDADGTDTENLNDEYVRIANMGSTNVTLSGWWLRSANPDSFRFPSGTVVKAGSHITLHVGRGVNNVTTGHFYWGYAWPRFSNPDVGAVGGGAYLFDPQGDIRAHSSYACVYLCTDPARGKVRMTVDYAAADEQVVITPVAEAVDLSYRTLERSGTTKTFARGTIVKPGQRLVVHLGYGTDTMMVKYWDKTTPTLRNAGAKIVLRNSESVTIVCTAWGDVRC